MEIPKKGELVDVSELCLRGVEGHALVERMDNAAETLEEAAEIFARDGVVSLSPSCLIEIVDDKGNGVHTNIEELTINAGDQTVAKLQDLWNSDDRDEEIKQKHYDAYNGTRRDMLTVSFDNVKEHFGFVIDLQHQLADTIRKVVADPTVEVSTDEDEGTVINLQLFNPDDPADTRQEHGAHTDRVDTTVVICLDNVGPQGDFVYLKGYNDACCSLGLDPHRNFAGNMNEVLTKKPESVIFRVYGVHPGRMLVIRTDQDVHFITAKSLGDVNEGRLSGAEPWKLGENILGRGIINAAFETDRCRRIFTLSKKIYRNYDGLSVLRGDNYFAALDSALKTEVAAGRLAEEEFEGVRNACVTQMSARQLYND